MQATQHESFVDFLASRIGLDPSAFPEPGEWDDAGNTIGMLALRMNLLTVEEIDQVLELQESEGNRRRFGELAESLGLLTQAQISRLLAVQALNRELERGERLVISGQLDIRRLVALLSEHVNGQHEMSSCDHS